MDIDTVTVQENRRKAVEALRNPDVPQGVGGLYNPETGCYCAYGLMGKAAGVDAAVEGQDCYWLIAEALGLFTDSEREVEQWILDMNDLERYTFPQIAVAVAAEWGIE